MGMTASNSVGELLERKTLDVPLPSRTLLLRDTRIRVLKFIIDWTEGTPTVLSKQVAQYVGLSRAQANAILRELVEEGILLTDEYYVKCLVCGGTGKSSAMHDQACVSCEGAGMKKVSPKPILYSVNRKAKGSLHWMFRCVEKVRAMTKER